MNAHGSDDGDVPEADVEFPQANVAAVRVVAATLGSTLGPLPRDKLLIAEQADDSDAAPGTRTAGNVAVASDGATILERLPIEHPIAPILRRMIGRARPGDTGVEGEAMPDGTTTRAVLAGALLNQAETLLDRGVHPQAIIAGYGRAQTIATDVVKAAGRDLADCPDTDAACLATARTAMTGNVAGGNREQWAQLIVEAVDIVGQPTETSFDVRRTRGGSIDDTYLVTGAVLDRHSRVSETMPARKTDASILLLDGHDRGGLMDREPTADVTLELSASDDVTKFNDARRQTKAAVVDGLGNLGVDVVVTRLGIDDTYARLLADAGILGVRGVSPLQLRRLAAGTDARPVADPTDVDAADLGTAGTVEEVTVGSNPNRATPQTAVIFDDCPAPESVAIYLHGVAGQVADQAATAVRKGAFALSLAAGHGDRPAGVVPGGGAVHVRAASAVRDAAGGVDNRSQLALEAYADALDHIVGTLARNSGVDPLAAVPDLRSAHDEGRTDAGLIVPENEVVDCLEAGVLDPVATVVDAYMYATDVATLLLRIDDAIDAVTSTEPTTDTDDVIYDEPAEMQTESLHDDH